MLVKTKNWLLFLFISLRCFNNSFLSAHNLVVTLVQVGDIVSWRTYMTNISKIWPAYRNRWILQIERFKGKEKTKTMIFYMEIVAKKLNQLERTLRFKRIELNRLDWRTWAIPHIQNSKSSYTWSILFAISWHILLFAISHLCRRYNYIRFAS